MRATAPVTPVTAWHHLGAIALLPLMNTVVIPTLILTATGFGGRDLVARAFGTLPATLASVTAILLVAAGLALAITSITLFWRRGEGTLAPWDPTQRLVLAGPYRFLRNPMKAGLFLILIGETLLLRSVPLAGWTTFFMLVNVIYIRVSEEPGLRKRFGASYDAYCASVPRWWPRRHAREDLGRHRSASVSADPGPMPAAERHAAGRLGSAPSLGAGTSS